MSTTSSVIARMAALAVAWIVLAVAGLILFGGAIDSHSNWGVICALAVAMADVIALSLLGARIFKLSRQL